MSNRNFVLILKCTEAPTVSDDSSGDHAVAGEDTNAYEKIHMYQINNDDNNNITQLKNIIEPAQSTTSSITKSKYDDNSNDNHAIIFIKLSDSNTLDDYQEIKYFKYKDISEKFINQIDTATATEMNCYQSTYAIRGITPYIVESYEGLNLIDIINNINTKNILINNGGKIVVTSLKNNDQLILHYVSKMFGFEDIIKDLGNIPVSDSGGDVQVRVKGEETSDFTAEKLAEYQNQKEQYQQGGKKKRSKQNTKKRNQK